MSGDLFNDVLKRVSFGSKDLHERAETRVCIFPGPD